MSVTANLLYFCFAFSWQRKDVNLMMSSDDKMLIVQEQQKHS